MSAGPSPLSSALLPMLMAKLAGAGGGGGGGGSPMGPMGGPGGPGTGPSGTPSDDMASASFGRELSSARQGDPGALGQTISSVKQQIMELINQTAMSHPAVARALMKSVQGIDAAVKEAATAAATLQVAQPIQASAATGAPGMGGASPPPAGMPGMGQF